MRGVLLESKPVTLPIRTLLFNIFKDNFEKMKQETLVGYKKILFVKEVLIAKSKQLMKETTEFDSLFKAFSIKDNLTLLAKLIEKLPDVVKINKATIAEEFYAYAMKTKDFTHI